MENPVRAITQCSVEDVIQILENEPPTGGWLFPHITTAQVMNRVSLAHLSIERTLKLLIYEKGAPVEKIHDLLDLFLKLKTHDAETGEFLEEAFRSAVRHYRLNPAAKHMSHFHSLERYLAETGSNEDFQEIRYWELEPSLDKPLLTQLFYVMHLELLYALHEILIEPDRTKETVEARVRWKVRKELWEEVGLNLRTGTVKGKPAEGYRQWLEQFPSWSKALADAVQGDFETGNEFVNVATRRAYTSLLESRDPAVRYFASSLDIIQRQPRDVIPHVEWLGKEENTQGMVKTPGGSIIGRIDRGPDGIWHIVAFRTGPAAVPAKANSKTDALCHVATLMSRPAWVTTDGERRKLRIVGEERHQFQRTGDSSSTVTAGESATSRDLIYRVTFWNADHGLEPSQFISIEVPRVGDDIPEGVQFIEVAEGTVQAAYGAEISIEGHIFTRIEETPTDAGSPREPNCGATDMPDNRSDVEPLREEPGTATSPDSADGQDQDAPEGPRREDLSPPIVELPEGQGVR